jgi:hypothetical protein
MWAEQILHERSVRQRREQDIAGRTNVRRNFTVCAVEIRLQSDIEENREGVARLVWRRPQTSPKQKTKTKNEKRKT